MKIACVAYLQGFGGAERQIINLANQMVERGHEVHLISMVENNITYAIDSRVNLVKIEINAKLPAFKTILARRKELISILSNLECDVSVHFNFQSAYLLAFSSKKRIGSVIYSERGDPGDKEYSGILGLVRYFAIKGINGFVFQSEGARRYFKNRRVLDNSIVIPNACFNSGSYPSNKREKRIVTVGRLSAQKNQALLIKSFAKIANEFDEYKLEIYGEGALKGQLIDLVKELSISEKVYFMGTTNLIAKKIKNASLFVLSSDYEGVPNVLIEAMSLGLPCISTDCRPGGARTLIEDGVNGIITPINDTDSLSDAMRLMLNNHRLSEKMALNATKIIEKLSPKIIYDLWESFFKEYEKKHI